jgi:hypothetical protein
MRTLAPLLLSAALLALPARAEPVSSPKSPPAPHDVIGRLLEGRPARDEDEPDTAGKARTAQDVETSVLPAPSGQPGPPTTYAPIPYAPGPRPQRDAPVFIEQTGKTPDAAPALRDMAYDSRIRASFAAAEGSTRCSSWIGATGWRACGATCAARGRSTPRAWWTTSSGRAPT